MKFSMLVNTQCPPDGKELPRLYDEILREAELADRLGFHGVYVPEHHLQQDGYLSAPLILLAAIAARTENIKLGTSILHLPTRHPVQVAEEVAVLDNLSNGRAMLGVGLVLVDRELNLFGVVRDKIVRRFNESLEIMQKCWKHESFSFEGHFFQLDEVNVMPKIVQDSIPMWIGALSEPALKRAAKAGMGWITDPLHNKDIMVEWAKTYRAALSEQGNSDKSAVALIRDCWVSHDPREIETVWWPTIRDYHMFYKSLGVFNSGSGRFNSTLEPWIAEISDDEWTMDRITPNRIIVGNPQQVIAQIEEYITGVGCDEIIFAFRHATGPSNERTMKCMELFAKEVMPHFS